MLFTAGSFGACCGIPRQQYSYLAATSAPSLISNIWWNLTKWGFSSLSFPHFPHMPTEGMHLSNVAARKLVFASCVGHFWVGCHGFGLGTIYCQHHSIQNTACFSSYLTTEFRSFSSLFAMIAGLCVECRWILEVCHAGAIEQSMNERMHAQPVWHDAIPPGAA